MPDQRPRQDSSRDLLEELEDGWGAAPSSKGLPAAAAAPHSSSPAPDVNDLDEGWLDQLFPEEEDDDEEEEESEPELPDERLDPVAFAAAKKAQAERNAARKDKKKQKLEAKRARQRAKAVALRQKQKGKSKRKAAPPSVKPEKKKSRAPKPPVREASTDAAETDSDLASDIADSGLPVTKPRAKASAVPAKTAPNTMQSIKLLAIVLVVLLAIGGLVAILAK